MITILPSDLVRVANSHVSRLCDSLDRNLCRENLVGQLYTMYLGVELNFLYPLMTLFTLSKKSFSLTLFLRARMENMPASVQTLCSSAPVVLGHSLAISSNRMSRSTFMRFE